MSEQRDVRIGKLELLRKAGVRPYADRFPRTHDLARARALAEGAAEGRDGPEVTTSGRVLAVRTFGTLVFVTLLDGSGTCQAALDGQALPPGAADLFARCVDLGDFIGVSGPTGKTRKGEPTVWARSWTFLAKALRPLPEKWHGLSDVERRQRQRYLDLLSHREGAAPAPAQAPPLGYHPQAVPAPRHAPFDAQLAQRDTLQRMRLRAAFTEALRASLLAHGFEEVDTPVLQAKPSGALARPFHTHHNALDLPCVLRIAPETWLKQAVAGGFDRVFEVARCFRNEGMDPSHLQEFTMVEWYAAWWDYRDNMDFTEGLVLHLLDRLLGTRRARFGDREIDFTPPWPRVTLRDLILRDSGIDIDQHATAASLRAAIATRGLELERDDLERLGRGTLVDVLYKKVSRPHLAAPTFVMDHPIDLSPLARRSDANPARTDRYQLVVNGWEVVNAYSELVDPLDQRARFEQQAAARAAGDDEALEVDEEYLLAMEHGMPPMSGWGMGVDRFVSLLTGQDTLREVVLFPLMKPEGGAGPAAAAPAAAPPAAAAGHAPPAKAPAAAPVAASPSAASPAAPAVAPAPAAGGEAMDPHWHHLLGHAADDVDDLGVTWERARHLFDEWVATPSLRRQMEMASVVMGALARRLGRNEAAWRVLGLLHNLDYDRVKDPARHCLEAAKVFKEEGMHPAGIHAIAAHNDDGLAATGIRCSSAMDNAVSCAEAVVGLVHATSQVLPSKDVRDLQLKSLVKRFHDRKFAATVERPLILRCEGLGLTLEEFLGLALEALKEAA
ncbi:MAG: amino acid--tRNA ligase-related protein [Planctomycetia bacterium]